MYPQAIKERKTLVGSENGDGFNLFCLLNLTTFARLLVRLLVAGYNAKILQKLNDATVETLK